MMPPHYRPAVLRSVGHAPDELDQVGLSIDAGGDIREGRFSLTLEEAERTALALLDAVAIQRYRALKSIFDGGSRDANTQATDVRVPPTSILVDELNFRRSLDRFRAGLADLSDLAKGRALEALQRKVLDGGVGFKTTTYKRALAPGGMYVRLEVVGMNEVCAAALAAAQEGEFGAAQDEKLRIAFLNGEAWETDANNVPIRPCPETNPAMLFVGERCRYLESVLEEGEMAATRNRDGEGQECTLQVAATVPRSSPDCRSAASAEDPIGERPTVESSAFHSTEVS
jgi:hypothetical protein